MSHSSLDQHAVNCAAASVRIAKGAVRKAHRPQDRDMEAIECLSIEIQGLPRFNPLLAMNSATSTFPRLK